MKILDSSFIIAFLGDIKCPKIIDCLLRLKHELIIPTSVYCEIIKGSSAKLCHQIIHTGKLKVVTLNKAVEIQDFKKTYPYLGDGEIDVILTYKKLKKKHNSIHCVLDDRSARKTAEALDASYTGSLGLLKLMRQRNVLGESEYNNTIELLKNSSFRLPREFVK